MLGAISYDPLVTVGIGPFSISPHGVGIAVGFLLGARLMLPTARRRGISDDDVYSLLTRAAIGALIGARVAYVINHTGDYSDNPIDVLKVWEGGISLLGGILGAVALALPQMRKLGHSFWKVMDAAAPGIALGIMVGRVGDLIVGDHLGTETDFFLGYRCPIDAETASPCVGDVVHQTALYDMLLTAVLLTTLLVLRRKPRYDGFLITVYGAMYGINRLIEDFLREDVRRFGLTGSQWTALTFLLLCGLHLLFVRKTPRWGRWDRTEPAAESAEHDLVGHGDPEGDPVTAMVAAEVVAPLAFEVLEPADQDPGRPFGEPAMEPDRSLAPEPASSGFSEQRTEAVDAEPEPSAPPAVDQGPAPGLLPSEGADEPPTMTRPHAPPEE